MANLLELIKSKGIKVTDVSRRLDIPPSRIYEWNKKGISEDNPHFSKLKEIIPEIQSTGKSKFAAKAGAKPKPALKLEDLPEVKITPISKDRPQKVYKDFPRVIFKKKDEV